MKPETGTVYRQSVSNAPAAIGAITLRGYTFEEPWELRCGDWIQEIWFANRKLLSQTFTVEGCEGVPISAREPMSVVSVRSSAGDPGRR